MDEKELFAADLENLFTTFADTNEEIEVISLATSDGFSVKSFIRNKHKFDSDTMSAAASTLYSVSKAVVKQILSMQFKSTFIEASEGNVCFVAFTTNQNDYVLAMAAGKNMNIASLRICINQLAAEITKIPGRKVA